MDQQTISIPSTISIHQGDDLVTVVLSHVEVVGCITEWSAGKAGLFWRCKVLVGVTWLDFWSSDKKYVEADRNLLLRLIAEREEMLRLAMGGEHLYLRRS